MRGAKNLLRSIVLLGVAALASSGCYGQRLDALEVRTARMEEKLTGLDRVNRDMSATLNAVQKLLNEEIVQARSGRAGNEQRLTEMQQLLQVLATRVDESGEQYRVLKDEVKYGASPKDSAGTGGTGGGAAAASPRSLYDAAYQDLTRGNHGLAIMGFQEVITKYPDSELADNSQYWIGESYYAQKNWKQALQEFEKTVSAYPKGDKVPAAMLKAGLCQAQLGDKKAAKATLDTLRKRYPDSEEARLAGTKLSEL
jgi:tol-pal system protein YbgF